MTNLDLEVTPGVILATCQLPSVVRQPRVGNTVWWGKSEWQEWIHDWCVSVELNIANSDPFSADYGNYASFQPKPVIFRPGAMRYAPEDNDSIVLIVEGTRLDINFVMPDCLQILKDGSWGSVATGRVKLHEHNYQFHATLSLDALYHTLALRRRKDALDFVENGSVVLTLHSRYHRTARA